MVRTASGDLQMSRPTMIIVLSRPIPLIFGFPAKMLTSLCWGVKLRQRHKMGTLSVYLPREGQYGSFPI
jgi:hypothetical protein